MCGKPRLEGFEEWLSRLKKSGETESSPKLRLLPMDTETQTDVQHRGWTPESTPTVWDAHF